MESVRTPGPVELLPSPVTGDAAAPVEPQDKGKDRKGKGKARGKRKGDSKQGKESKAQGSSKKSGGKKRKKR
ncbi:MAG TPA: hypothetical protein VIW29_02195 [Polyangiaceae bacterium]